MHSELRGTDIKWIARGYWARRFNGRVHPKVKTPWLVALITLVAGVTIAIADVVDVVDVVDKANSAVLEPKPSATVWVAVPLVIVALGFFLKGQFSYEAEQTKFVDKAVAAWEAGNHNIPDAETVEEYINGG